MPKPTKKKEESLREKLERTWDVLGTGMASQAKKEKEGYPAKLKKDMEEAGA